MTGFYKVTVFTRRNFLNIVLFPLSKSLFKANALQAFPLRTDKSECLYMHINEIAATYAH